MSSRALRWDRDALVPAFVGLLVGGSLAMRAIPARAWSTFAGNSQHTAVSSTGAQPLEVLHWFTPVDLAPPTGTIFIHYGSPLVTPANTVIVSVKTGSAGGYRVDARNGTDGSLLWSQSTDYILPPHNWTPSYSPALTPTNRLYFPGAGGTIYFRDNVDSGGPASTGQLAFFGMSNYLADPASYNSTVFVNTPITADSAGNIYFGFRVSGTAPLGLRSGIARIDSNGSGTWSSAVDASGGDPAITSVPHQAAPALSGDEHTLYVVVTSDSTATNRYLIGLDPATLALKESSPGVKVRVALKDPRNGGINNAIVSDDSSASPTVGPDGDVYYGVLGNPFDGPRGWMLHFSADLTQTKTPGAFGWDSTASVVAASMVPSYTGTSSYLIFTKYNNYAGLDGGDGVNKIAVLDPNDTMVEPHASSNGQLVMKEVLTIAGPTADLDHVAQFPNAVREWCINSAVVDPLTKSVMVNSEDGKVYRWDLTTNTLSAAVTLSPGVGEAYTPTIIGPDGTVYAINWAILNAVGRLTPTTPTNTPETTTPTGTPPNTPTPTFAPFGISGHIIYYGSSLPVPNVAVELQGPSGGSVFTDANGQYDFTNIGGPTWTVVPRKLGDGNGAITALDAVFALQAAVGLRALSSEQSLATDGNGDGTITAIDGSYLLQYRVGLIPQLPIAQRCGSDWVFVPVAAAAANQLITMPEMGPDSCQMGAITYMPLTSQANGQDFLAIFLGDANGSWSEQP